MKTQIYGLIAVYAILVMCSAIVLVHNQSTKDTAINSLIDTNPIEHENIQCHFPQLSLNSNSLEFLIPKPFQPKCLSWFFPIIIENYHLRLILREIYCTAIFYIGEGDREYKNISVPLLYDVNVLLLSDYFTVKCHDARKNTMYPSLPYLSMHYNSLVRKRLEKITLTEDDYNVLILGLDSVSRLQFERMLPQTFRYLTDTLHGVILKGYNILGDGTPQQLIPMLTGFKETELPSTLERDLNASFVDVYPFIWNLYSQKGYVTGYAEDRIEYGIWTLRLKGFQKNPTDHYLSQFYRMEATQSLLFRNDAHCIRNQTSFELFLSYIDQFWSSYANKKKFFLAFFKQYTHDGYFAGSSLDSSLTKFLKNFNRNNNLEKTIVLLMTDHGARFSAVRQTPQGKLEERLPFMSFIFPKSFQTKYSQAIQNLHKNIDRLTTPFDIHSTLLSLLNMSLLNSSTNYQVRQRNISLFHLIPAHRTCDDINLEPHWCSCLQWHDIHLNETKVRQATEYVINYINQQLLTVKNNLCYQLQLHSIRTAQIYKPNKALLTFSRSSDIDGRVPAYEDQKTDIMFYQIMLETQPNKAIYEATVHYSNSSNSFNVDLNHISRLNAYKSSASCIEKSYSHLRKFCRCIH